MKQQFLDWLAAKKQRAIDLYNTHIVAGWYRSLAILGGWATTGILFAPDLLAFAVDHWDILSGLALPKFSPETKALTLAIFTAFVLPPLRAWQQKKMQEAALKQAVGNGVVSSLPFTTEIKIDVSAKP